MSDPSRYFDAASAAPLHPVAREAMLGALADGWADPRRLYTDGRRARALLDAAREAVAEGIGARADEVSFTGSGVTALHAAVLGTLRGNRRAGRTLVHSAVEHSAVLQAGRWHAAGGGRTASIAVDSQARVDVDGFIAATLGRDVAAAALQVANHEVGTTQPIETIAAHIGDRPLVVDATSSTTLSPLPTGWSVLAADPRTWGAPPGTGVLAVRTGIRWASPYPDDDGSDPRWPGALDLPSIVAAAAALQAVRLDQAAETVRLRKLTTRIRTQLAATVPDAVLLGDPHDRLPHLVAFSCLYVDGETLVGELDRRGFAVSSGSSCASSALEPSHVLIAMGALTSGNVRVSLHRQSTEAAVEEFLAILPAIVASIRADLGAVGL